MKVFIKNSISTKKVKFPAGLPRVRITITDTFLEPSVPFEIEKVRVRKTEGF
jgi:hypothetical protein